MEVVSVTDTTAHLTWVEPDGSQPLDEIEYVVEKRKSGRKIWTEVKTTTATELEIPGLQEGEAYDFRVTPRNDLGQGQPAETPESVHTKTKPEPPTAVHMAEQKKTPLLEWQIPKAGEQPAGFSEIETFIVEERTSEQPRWHEVARLPADHPEFEVTFKTFEKEKELRVISVNDIGPSQPSRAVTVKKPVVKPAKPVAPVEQLEATEVTDSTVTLSWEEPVDASPATQPMEYKVEKRPAGTSKSWSKVTTTTATEVEITGLAEGEANEFRVTPQNKLGAGEPAVTAEPVYTKSRPEAPVDVHVAATHETPTIEWTKPEPKAGRSPIVKYIVEEKTETESTWHKVAELGPEEESYDVAFDEDESKKEIRVISVNEIGESKPSAPVTVVEEREDTTETLVTKTTKTTTTTTTKTTTSAVTGEVSEEELSEVEAVPVKPAVKSPKKDRAVKSKPETPQNVEVVSEDQETLTVQWSAPAEPVVKYIVEEKTAEKRTWHKVAEVEPEETSYAVPFRAGETEKQVRVISVNEAGESPPSAPVTVVEDEEYPEKSKEKVVKKVTKTKTTTTTTVETESNIGEEELEDVPAKRGESVTPKSAQVAKKSKPEAPQNIAVTTSDDLESVTVQWSKPRG